MKSTKVKIGFLLAALAAVLFTGCNQLTTKNVPTEFGVAGRKERIANEERRVKSEAWKTFYTAFTNGITGSTTPYNLKNADVAKDKIVDRVNAVNAYLKKQATEKKKVEHKFDGTKKLTTVVYAQLTYTGSGESKDVYKDLLGGGFYTDEVAAKFSNNFNIEITGDIGAYLDESVGAGK